MKTTPEADSARKDLITALKASCNDSHKTNFTRDLFKSGYWENLGYGLDFLVDLFGRNASRSFMGSFSGVADVKSVDCNKCCAIVDFTMTNNAGWESASRMPKVGYK